VNSDSFLLGLSNIPSDAPLLLAPNPVAEQLTIRCTDALQAEWLISDIAGQAIRTGRFTSSTLLQLDISTIPPGIYFFSLDTAQGRATRRFIIAR